MSRRERDFMAREYERMQAELARDPTERVYRPRPDYHSFPGSLPATRRRLNGDINNDVSYQENRTNWYMLPKEVIDFFIRNRRFCSSDDKMHLDKIKEFFDEAESIPEFYASYPFQNERTHKDFDLPGFLQNEICKMFADKELTDEKDWITPYISRNTLLCIPGKDIRDLQLYLALYILHFLCQELHRWRSFSLGYQFGPDGDTEQFPLLMRKGKPVTVNNGIITVPNFKKMFTELMYRFVNLLPEAASGATTTWSGSDESGTRIILRNYAATHTLYLHLATVAAGTIYGGHRWTQEVEDMLAKTVGNAVISVRNKDDNKCLIYCIVMGLIIKFKPSGGRAFGTSTFVDSTEVYSKGMYLFTDDSELTQLIHRLTSYLMPLGVASDPVAKLLDEVEKQYDEAISIADFREDFSKLEHALLPKSMKIGVDVYGIDMNVNKHVYPLYISKIREKTIDLLCVTPADMRMSHYCLILNMEKLMKGSGGKQFFSCSKCGGCFYHRRLLKDHKCPAVAQPNSITIGDENGYHYSKIGVDPNRDTIKGICSKCRLCFVTDFENEYHREHCLMSGKTGYRHVQLVTYKPEEQPVLNGVELDMDAEEKIVQRSKLMYADFESSINPEDGKHTFMSYGLYDWKSGLYQCGYDIQEFIEAVAAAAFCGDEDQIYVYFHNAMGYDANFILSFILKHEEYSSWGIQVIMKSSNRLQKLVFHVTREGVTRNIHIGDTFLFLTLSLERIVGSIRKDDLTMNMMNFPRFFDTMKLRYPWVDEYEIDHILRKNIFPYKFFTDSEKLKVKANDFLAIFEPKEENLQYFSERVTIEDLEKSYPDTRHVMETFACREARDYHDLYLCCDVMQLADVFDRSMKILWESHHIHLMKYIGMPSASWAAFLRHTPTMQIPLYDNTFFAEFFKGMIRGGITSAALRHAVADETHSIIYLDVNGLYPYVMQKYEFPCGGFRLIQLNWESDIERKLNDMFIRFEATHTGMCFCVDMTFPDSVKKMTDMYPFAPEHRKIYDEYFQDEEKTKLTPFLAKWSEANAEERMTEFKGLVCTLYDKEKYNVHWRLLKFYMEHGVIITKVWFGVAFDEGDYLAGYIRKNIAIRNERKDELGKTLYKLLGNSIYGKTFESPFKRNTYEIVRNLAKLQGLLEEGNIASFTPIDDAGWIVRLDGEDIILDKPTYIGACVCEFSKLHMYTLLYDKLMKIFPECQLVYTDTDSFIVYVKHPDGVGSEPKQLFDYIKSVDPELIGGIGGQVKSETGEDDTIQEVIALRSKVYAYITKKGHLGKRAKGTTYDAQELQLDWETYKRALESLVSVNTRNAQFVRKNFKIASLDVYRQSLSVNDGKRFICEDGIHTHAFGY